MPVRIEGLTIGDELLDGRTVDGNAARIDAALAVHGLRTARRAVIPDDVAAIAAELHAIAARADLCLITGGLGPTSDDCTAQAVAEAAGVALVEHPEALRQLCASLGERPLTPARRKQALAPAGARIIPNPVGTAPAFVVQLGRCRLWALPGVPREVEALLSQSLAELLPAQADPLISRSLRFVLLGESTVAAQVQQLTLPPGLTVGYRAQGPITELSFRGQDAAAVDAAVTAARAAAPAACLPDGLDLPAATLAAARVRGCRVATAESCTGGLVGAALTAVPGASDAFLGGVIAYANAVKQAALGVPEAVIQEAGAVSEACARAMAAGAARALGADAAVSITGIAGPGGGTPDKPVGTVWFGWWGPGFDHAERHHLRGDREQIRRFAVAWALDGLRQRLGTPWTP